MFPLQNLQFQLMIIFMTNHSKFFNGLNRISVRMSLTFVIAFGFIGMAVAQLNSDSPSAPLIKTELSVPESASLLSRYIQYPSVSGNEKEAAEYLLSVCREKGFSIRLFSDKNGGYNFAASLYPLDLGLPNVIFLNHIDVVPPGDLSDWDFKPFSGKIEKGMIFGRGAIDMKGMAIMQGAQRK